MTLQRNRKKQQRRNLLLAGGGIGLAAAGALALTRRPQPRSTPSASGVLGKPVSSVRSIGISSIKPTGRAVRGGAIVHVPGKGREYYPSSPLVERTVRLGKPAGRARQRKNWNAWDSYKDTHKGAYNLRNTRRYDKGRIR